MGGAGRWTAFVRLPLLAVRAVDVRVPAIETPRLGVTYRDVQ